MGMSVFFDTEFTTLDPNETPNLISIGCVSQDGRELYMELVDTWSYENCSQFVRDIVLLLLDRSEMIKEADAAIRLRDWVESLGSSEVIFRSDNPAFDWPHVEHLFGTYGCWPKNLRQTCGTICFESSIFQDRYDAAMHRYWRERGELRRHHALEDARSMQYAWKSAIRRGLLG